MNLILNINTKASKFGDANLVIYKELIKLPLHLDLNRFQFKPPDSSIKNSRANNDNLWNETGDSILDTMSLAPPTIDNFLACPLSKFITFGTNSCRYNGSFTEIFVTAVNPFFLKAKSETSKGDNPCR